MNILKPHKKTTIATLLERGQSQREIERLSGVNRRTIRAYQKQAAVDAANCSTLSTGPKESAPPRPPAPKWTPSACESRRNFIEAQVRLHRKAMAIYQDLVDHHGFPRSGPVACTG